MIKQKVLGAILAFMTALALPLPAFAAGLNGAELSIGWVLPFAGILLSPPSYISSRTISGVPFESVVINAISYS